LLVAGLNQSRAGMEQIDRCRAQSRDQSRRGGAQARRSSDQRELDDPR
jgi:hypothetical protein